MIRGRLRANEEAYERGKKRARKKAASRARKAKKSRPPAIRGRLRANEEAYERGRKRARKKAAARAEKASKTRPPVIRGRLRANEEAYERGKKRARANRKSGARNQPVAWRPWPGGGGGGGGFGAAFSRGSKMGGGAQRGPGKPFIPEAAMPFTNAREVGAYLKLFRPTGPVLQRKLKRAGWSPRPERARGGPNYIRLPDGRKVRSRSQGPGAIWTSPDGNYSVRIMTERIVGGLRRRAIISKKVRDRQGREHWQPLDKDGKPAGRDKTHHILETVPIRGHSHPEPGIPFRPGQGGHL